MATGRPRWVLRLGGQGEEGGHTCDEDTGWATFIISQQSLRPVDLPRARARARAQALVLHLANSSCRAGALHGCGDGGGPIERADTIVRGPLGQGPGPRGWMQGVEAMQREPEGSSPVLVREVPPSWRDCIWGSTSTSSRPIGRCLTAWWSGRTADYPGCLADTSVASRALRHLATSRCAIAKSRIIVLYVDWALGLGSFCLMATTYSWCFDDGAVNGQ